MTYRFPINKGDRVAIAPHNDLWMAGCRFGEVVHINRDRLGTVHFYNVRLDTGAVVSFVPEDLLGAVGDRPVETDEVDPVTPEAFAVMHGAPLIEHSDEPDTLTRAQVKEVIENLIGDGQGDEIGLNPEYSRACWEIARDLGIWMASDPERECLLADCGYGECSWLQDGPVEGMCNTHGNGEGRCQQESIPLHDPNMPPL